MEISTNKNDEFIAWIVSLRNELIYFSIILSIPSLILYIFEIIIIILKKQFHNSFYFLFCLRAIMDILYVLDSYYGFRLPTLFGHLILPFYKQLPKIFLSLFSVISTFAYQGNNYATTFILLNRLTAVVFPFNHEKLWRKLLPISILFTIILPAYFSFDYFNMEMEIVELDKNSFLLLEKFGGTYLMKMNQFTSIFSLVFLFICLALSISTFFVYRIKLSKIQNSTENSKIQIRLLFYALITLFGHLLCSIIMLLFWVIYKIDPTGNQPIFKAVYQQYPWVMDISTVVLSSWSLLWANDTFRQELFKFFLPKRLLKNSLNTLVEPINLTNQNLNNNQRIINSVPKYQNFINNPNII